MSHSGRIYPGSISAAKDANSSGTVRGANKLGEPTHCAGQPAPEHLNVTSHENWLHIERIESIKQEHKMRLRAVYLLFGMTMVVFVAGMGILFLCAYYGLTDDAIAAFLASVLSIISAAFGGVIGFLFGRRLPMT